MSKETKALSNTLEKTELRVIYRISHPEAAGYTFVSSVHGTLSRINHILGHKKSLRKLKKTEIVSSSFSYHNGTKLELNYKKKTKKPETHGGITACS